MKTVFYRQCHLKNKNGFEMTSWIPDQYAVLNKVIKLKDKDGKWEDGWVVQTVGSNKIESKEVPDEHQYKR